MAFGDSKLHLVLAVLVIILVAGGTSFLVLRMFIDSPSEEEVAGELPEEIGETYEFGDVTVNLADAGGRRFLRATLVFEISSSRVEDELIERSPQVRDRILSTLRGKEAADISKDPEVKELKQEIIDKINPLLRHGEITDLWFTEFVIQ